MTREIRVRAGKMRDLVDVQERLDTKNADGTFSPSWTSLGRTWADVSLASRGAEAERAEQVKTNTIYTVRMRYRSDVTEKHRLILFGSPGEDQQVLEIISRPGDPDGRRRVLEMTCQTGLKDATDG